MIKFSLFMIMFILAINTNGAPMFRPSNKTEPTYYYDDYNEFVLDEIPSDDYYYFNYDSNNGDEDSILSDDYSMYKAEKEAAKLATEDDKNNDEKLLIAQPNTERIHEIKNSETIVIDSLGFPLLKDLQNKKTNKPYSTDAFKDAFRGRTEFSDLYSIKVAKGHQESLNEKKLIKKNVISNNTYYSIFVVLTFSIVMLALVLTIVFVVVRVKREKKSRTIKKTPGQQQEYKTVGQAYI